MHCTVYIENVVFWCEHSVFICFFSAKTRDGVQEAFEELVQKVIQTPSLYTAEEAQEGFNISQNSGSQQSQQDGWCGC